MLWVMNLKDLIKDTKISTIKMPPKIKCKHRWRKVVHSEIQEWDRCTKCGKSKQKYKYRD